MFFQVQQVGDFRAAPAVDALVVIADHAKIPVLLRERVDQLELRGVGVLIFVHHDVLIFGAAGGERVGMLAEQPQREQNQIVEIHGVAGVQRGFVALGDVLRQRADAWDRTNALEFSPPFLNLLNIASTAPGSAFSPFAEMAGKNFLHRRELLRFVVDDETFLVAELLDVLAQNADAKRMEGANRRAVRFLSSGF